MNKVNYNKLMLEEILKNNGEKKKLLLHSCCAPCSTACIERLKEHFDLTIYYYNPNIDTFEEFTHRANEQIKYCEKVGVGCVVEDYDKQAFLSASKGKEKEKEGGARCKECFNLRLSKTAKKAKNERK